MNSRVQRFPKGRVILAGIGVIWLTVTAWLILQPPDPVVGEWIGWDVRLTVGRDSYWMTVSGQVTVSGRWSRIQMPVYQWKRGIHSSQSGRVVSGFAYTTYYAQSDLDEDPTLRDHAQLTPVQNGRAYQMENHPAAIVLVERKPGELRLYWGGQSFGSRKIPRPWWETAWKRIQTWGRT